MAYQGESGQHFINFNALSFTTVEVIVVTGITPCGHTLLQIDGFYFHISGVYDYPKFMNKIQFARYLRENDKTILFTTRRYFKNKKAALKKLKNLLKEKWSWLVIPHNCMSFAEDIVAAGEDDMALITNCPTLLQSKLMIKSGEWRKNKY